MTERWLNLVLHDSTGAPLAERPFTIAWSTGAGSEGATDASGRLSVAVPADATTASLLISHRRLDLELGTLPGVDTVEGVQERLNLMNYFAGRVDGDHGPRTSNAVQSFQRAQGLPETGEADASTAARVAQVFGDRG